MNNWCTYLFCLIFGISFSQNDSIVVSPIDSVAIAPDSLAPIDVSNFEPYNNVILNDKALNSFYDKLFHLEQNKDRKIRIVHIGDSHIQADLFVAQMRNHLQKQFGNAGFGFTFPYAVARTNNSAPIRFESKGSFDAVRNLFASSDKPVGLSGIALQANSKNASIEINIKDSKYFFTNLKTVTLDNENYISIVKDVKKIAHQVQVPKKITHTVKPGEVLGSIANKYDISIKQLKLANGLKSDMIRDGKKLIIPSKKTTPKQSFTYEYVKDTLKPINNWFEYQFANPKQSVELVIERESGKKAINGFVLENNDSGITYSGIGVNGAKCSDYNKFPLFYEQLPVLQADLVVISLGTNESFDLQDSNKYFDELTKMIANIRAKLPETAILVTSPPPSKLHRKSYNKYIDEYATSIVNNTVAQNYASWNLLEVLGGNKNITLNSRMGLMAKDKVHYSKLGYEKQADLFFGALIQSYELFKSKK